MNIEQKIILNELLVKLLECYNLQNAFYRNRPSDEFEFSTSYPEFHNIKQFISTLLKVEREETIEIGDKMKKKCDIQSESIFENRKIGYNQALLDYQTKIKSLKQK